MNIEYKRSIYVYTYTYTYIYTEWNITQTKNNEFLLLMATWMDWEGIMISEIRQREQRL